MMPLVYLVADHWSNFEDALYRAGVRRFFVTDVRFVKVFMDRGCDVVLDNGAYRFGRAMFSWSLLGARLGIKYVLPDVLGDPSKTVALHTRFADAVSERELSRGFVVLQGATFSENVRQLERLRELGIVKRYVALGGPKWLRRRAGYDKRLVSRLYRYVKRYGYHLHVLGRARKQCDSFDTASWGYRLLDQKLRGASYSIDPILRFIKRYEDGSAMPRFRVVVEVTCRDVLDYGALGKARCDAEAAASLVKKLLSASMFARPRGVSIRVIRVGEVG